MEFKIPLIYLFFKKHIRCVRNCEPLGVSEYPEVRHGCHSINDNNTTSNDIINARDFPYNQQVGRPLTVPTISAIVEAPPAYKTIMIHDYGKTVQRYCWLNTSNVVKCT